MTKQWGLLCPEGHGLLTERDEWTRRGVSWCPSNVHGGNGRFYRRQEVEEGWFDPTRIVPDTSRADELARIATERSAAWEANNRRRRVTENTTPAEKAPRKAKEPQDCTCGCGGQTKGGRFLPGHDARYHAAEKRKAAEAEAKAHPAPEPVKTTGKSKKAKAPDLTAKADEAPAQAESFEV